jgi:arylsulfatase A-like enzyme
LTRFEVIRVFIAIKIFLINFAQNVQIDIVPTLASLLGVPIPFANLGQLLPDLFLQSTLPTDAPPLAIEFDRWKNYAAALRQNAWQVHRYLQVVC